MHLSDFDFQLPDELIAQAPLEERSASRMLVVDRARGEWADRAFLDLPGLLRPGDCLVLNNTRVFPARLLGRREGFAGEVETLLVRAHEGDGLTWQCLVRPGRKIRTGERLVFGGGALHALVLGRDEFGERTLRFECTGGAREFFEQVERIGHVPLPPYIDRPDSPADRERYQTVFASNRGSVAAPTAGLHFTPGVLDACRRAGASTACVTLHVGLGTFAPLRAERLEDVELHAEHFEIEPEAAAVINAATRRIAVGTTSVRTLETAMQRGGGIAPMSGDTGLFISPGFRFAAVDAMLTNFHLPKSSLFVLVSAFMGRELALAAYRHAIDARYRFYSYGDCMLIL